MDTVRMLEILDECTGTTLRKNGAVRKNEVFVTITRDPEDGALVGALIRPEKVSDYADELEGVLEQWPNNGYHSIWNGKLWSCHNIDAVIKDALPKKLRKKHTQAYSNILIAIGDHLQWWNIVQPFTVLVIGSGLDTTVRVKRYPLGVVGIL